MNAMIHKKLKEEPILSYTDVIDDHRKIIYDLTGSIYHCFDNVFHRDDGPACIIKDFTGKIIVEEYWVHGTFMTKQDYHNRLLKFWKE